MSGGAAEASAQHPFLHGLPEEQRPDGWEEDVASVRQWVATRPHLPPISDDFLLLFLHSCYMDVARAQSTIESYFTCKSRWPELFGNRDPLAPELQKVLDSTNMVPLPERTPEGYHVLLYRMVETDPSKLHFVTAMRMFFVFNDAVLSDDGLAPGYVVVFDMAGVSWGHLARVSLPAIRKFMIYIQDCHPARLKGVHVINTVAFIDRILGLIKPLIKSDLLAMVHFHGPVESLDRFLPLRLLPEDYGGEAESAQTLHDAMRMRLEKEYREWFIAEEKMRVDFSKRPPKNNKANTKARPPKGVVPPRPPAPEQGPPALDEQLGATASDFRHLAID
ncbi:hypothetical protein R5R35_005904 [Gryllus longicercus]|uniref:CRAL-TRIO domain-containing protein n=1 Tax=Gryllus longicercus TaxID=2509291 RepID=A0AAN9Z3J2_9ORTH